MDSTASDVSSTPSTSMSETRSTIGFHERLITIVSHNAPDTPAKFLLMKPMTYQELSEALSTRESSPVTTLVFVPIPYPHYRLPREGELISPWTRSTFTIPLQEGLMLTVVRTLTGDKTKVFKYSELNRSSGTMEEILSPLLRRDTLVIRSIQACSTGSDIRSNIFSIQDLKSINTFPTIAFIDTIDDYPKFLTRISSTASRPIKVLGTFAEKLIEKASISDVAPLQKIHIARGAFHLIASAAGAKQTTGLNEEQLADILELEGLLSDIEECIGLDQYDAAKDAIERLFYQLCEDRPGAFEVRCSYDKFVEFKYIDGGAASQFALKAHELEEPPSMGLSQLFEVESFFQSTPRDSPSWATYETHVVPRKSASSETSDSYQQRLKIKQILEKLRHEGPGISAAIDVPQLVVIGSQSSGKSSLFEGISGVSLPRDAGTCTRCPIICRMTYSKEGPWRCRISLIREQATESRDGKSMTHISFGEEILDRQSVCDRIRGAQAAILQPQVDPDVFLKGYKNPRNQGFSSDAILVEITGPDIADLSFVDLPGFIQMDEKNPGNVEKIQQLVTSYVKNDSSLILLVYKCSDDVSNQGAGAVAKKYDTKGTRTITVLTMPDRVDPGQEGQWKDLIRTSRECFCVRQPGYRQLATMTREAARKQEADFFQNDPEWEDLLKDPEVRRRLGTENLTNYLNARLLEWIVERLPMTLEDVQRHIKEIDRELTRFPVTVMDPVKATSKILWEFERKMSATVDFHNFRIPELVGTCRRRMGEFVDVLLYHLYPRFWPLERKDGISPKPTDVNAFPPVLPKIKTFSSEIPRGGAPPDVVYIDEVMIQSSIQRSRELPGNASYGVLKEYMENSVDVWRGPTISMVDDIVREIVSTLEPIVWEHFGSYTLKRRIWEEVESHIQSRGDSTREKLMYCITREKAMPMIFSHSEFLHYRQVYLEHYMLLRKGDHDHSQGDDDDNDDPESPIMHAGGGAALDSVDQVLHGGGEEMSAPTDSGGTNEGVAAGSKTSTKAKGFSSSKARRPSGTSSHSADEQNAIDIMAQTRAFYHIAARCFAEGAAHVVFNDLLVELQSSPSLQQKLRDVIGMSGPDFVTNCQRFLEPSGEVVRERNELLRMRAILQDSLIELNSFVTRDVSLRPI